MGLQISYGVLTDGKGNESHVVIPEGVRRIGSGAFSWNTSVVSISFPDSITSSDSNAFQGCKNIKEIHFNSLSSWLSSDISFALHDLFEQGAVLYFDNEPVYEVDFPKGMAEIPSSAFYGYTQLKKVIIPEGVKEIGNSAFSFCKGLKEVILPKTLKTIGGSAFWSCEKLEAIRIPSGVEDIGSDAFYGCFNLESITLPDRVSLKTGGFSGGGTFADCKKLERIEFPGDVYKIEKWSFRGCTNLKEVVFKKKVSYMIGKDAFASCHKDIVVRFPKDELMKGPGIPYIKHVQIPVDFTDEELVSLWVNQTEKATWRSWMISESKFSDPEAALASILNFLSMQTKINKQTGKDIGEFIIKYSEVLSQNIIQRAISILDEKKCLATADLKKTPEIIQALNGAGHEENPVESKVKSYLKGMEVDDRIESVIKKGVPYAESSDLCSRNVIVYLISAYPFNQEQILREKQLKLNEQADQVAAVLDKKELSKLLTKLVNGSNFELYLLSWSRYAVDEDVENTFSKHLSFSRGKPKFDSKGGRFFTALMYSDSKAAMKFYDQCGELDRYAKIRDLNSMEIRDTLMLPDFSFDEDGIKRYDIGGNIIEVSITPELGFSLFDVKKQKEIRSFPKTSDDSSKAEACAQDYAAFKKQVLSFAKDRSLLLHKMHLSGEYVKKEYWQKIYVEHPVIKHLARLIVWQDEKEYTFIIDEKGIINSSGACYEPGGKIRIAHVTDLASTEINSWQKWFIESGKKQLFEQIWEPVISWNTEEIANRYNGAVVGKDERNAVKNALKRRFIDVFAEDMDRVYNPRTGAYEFSNDGTLDYGKCLKLDYTVDPDKNETTFGKAKPLVKPGDREMNTVLLELDRGTLSFQIAKDNDTALIPQKLSVYSVAQIQSLLALAIEKKATKCTAILLDFKNRYFPEYADVNEFSLDW